MRVNGLLNKLGLALIKIINERKEVSVYKVAKKSDFFVLKVHANRLHYMREVEAIKELSKRQLSIPRLIQSDKFDEGFYLLQEWWEGTTLLEEFPRFSFSQKKNLLHQMGCLLGQINICMSEKEIIKSNLWKYAYEEIRDFESYSWTNVYIDQFPTWLQHIKFKNTDMLIEVEKVLNKIKHKLESPECSYSLGIIHRDYGIRNIMVQDDRILGIIDFEHTIAGDPIFDLSKLIFNDISYTTDIDLRNSFFHGWRSITCQDIAQDRLNTYLAIQGVGAIQWVDRQKIADQKKYKAYRDKGIDVLLETIPLI